MVTYACWHSRQDAPIHLPILAVGIAKATLHTQNDRATSSILYQVHACLLRACCSACHVLNHAHCDKQLKFLPPLLLKQSRSLSDRPTQPAKASHLLKSLDALAHGHVKLPTS